MSYNPANGIHLSSESNRALDSEGTSIGQGHSPVDLRDPARNSAAARYLYLAFPHRYVLEGVGRYYTWGIRGFPLGKSFFTHGIRVQDVSVNGGFTLGLAMRCTKGQVAPWQLEDIILDSIP